jgi:hypothetical protein
VVAVVELGLLQLEVEAVLVVFKYLVVNPFLHAQ